jgi:hypothetical protein
MQFITQQTKEWPKPKWIKSNLMYSQMTLSKDFDRSTLNVMALYFWVWIVWRLSYEILIAWWICLRRRNPNRSSRCYHSKFIWFFE